MTPLFPSYVTLVSLAMQNLFPHLQSGNKNSFIRYLLHGLNEKIYVKYLAWFCYSICVP